MDVTGYSPREEWANRLSHGLGLLLGGLVAVGAMWGWRQWSARPAARAAADYLIGTFELANPATENPRTITALTILGRSADRARNELSGQPELQIRLIDTVARAYNNLGLFDEAQAALDPWSGPCGRRREARRPTAAAWREG